MKKLLLLGLLIANCQLLSVNLFAQAPKLMNYQGVARDINGQTLTNKQITLRLSILSAADITKPIYTEEQSVKTTEFGLFALKIGEGNPVKGSMDAIDWGSADHFIAVELDAENNGHFAFMGTSQLLSVPYAFYAERSGTAKDIENISDFRAIDFGGTAGQTIRHNGSDWEATSGLFHSGGNVGVGTTSPSAKLDVDGSVNLSTGNEIKVNGTRALALNGIQNVMIGHQAGNSVTTGDKNLFIGWQAGRDVNTGENNTMLGYRAGFVTTDGRNNNMIGNLAGFSNTIGNNNSFIGYRAGYSNTIGLNNYYAGTNAGHNGTTGSNNMALGTAAGFNLGSGSDNTLIGRNAGYNTTGDANVFIGKEAGIMDTSGINNTYIGTGADGAGNLTNATAIGANTSVATSNSVVLGNSANVGIGTNAPDDKLHVVGNIRMVDGNQAAGYITVADSNGVMTWTSPSAISPSSLSDADNDTRILVEPFSDYDEIHFSLGGTQRYSMRRNGLGVSNTGNSIFIGTFAGNDDDLTNNANIGIGTSALDDNTSGENNIALGYLSMLFNQTGSDNVAIGNASLILNGSGGDNVVIGDNAMISASTSNDNSVVGGEALAALITGGSNTAIGRSALKQGTSGTRNTALGYQAGYNANGLTNATAIGANTEVGCDSCLVLGDASNVGIGTTTPSNKLHVVGNIRMVDGNQAAGYVPVSSANGTMTWTSPSAISPASLKDADGDTKIQVEESADEDKIRFDLAGNEVMRMEKNSDNDLQLIVASGGTATYNVFMGNNETGQSNTGEFNVGLGYQALQGNNSGRSNTAIGYLTLQGNTSGDYNTAIGEAALFSNTSGDNNIGIGTIALNSNTTGSNNIGLGFFAGFFNTTGSGNILLGYAAGHGASQHAKNNNVMIGYEAGRTNNGDANVFIGNMAGRNESGSNRLYIENTNADKDNALIYGEFDNNILAFNANVGVGTTTPADKLHVIGDIRLDAGRMDVRNTGGSVIIGENAGAVDDFSNNYNIFVGTQAGLVTTTGEFNAGIGAYSLVNNSTGGYNVGVGASAIGNVTTGSYNSALGVNALALGGSTDEKNTAIGFEAGNNITGSSNVFIGYRAGRQRSGSNQLFIENSGADKNNALIYGEFDNNILAFNANVGVGTSTPIDKLHVVGNMRLDAGRIQVWNTGGSVLIGENAGAEDDFNERDNIFIGSEAGFSTDTGQFNVGVGPYTLYDNTGGAYNAALGYNALTGPATGSYTVALGAGALSMSGSSDEKNTAVGFEAGANSSGSGNVFIGYRAGKNRSVSNQLFIENTGADADEALIYGEFDNDILALNANVGVGTVVPAEKLHVQGSVRIVDGTQGNGKVLTSDASGSASWQTLPTSSDDQTIDQFTISNDTLQLSLESDGQAPQVVSLVGYKVPVGTITMYIGESDNIPDGWLFCGGQSFSGATYPELQALLGSTNTPNLKSRFPLGANPIVNVGETPYPLKGTGGEEEVTLTTDEMPAHTHDVTVTFREAQEQGSGNNYSDLNGGSSDSRTYTSASTGGGQAHNNMPPYYTVNFIIKAN